LATKVSNCWRRIGFAAGALGALAACLAGEVCASGGGGHAAPAVVEEVADSDSPIRGIELGEFRVRAYYPIEAKRSTVTYRLHAVVSSERAREFRSFLENRRHKVRDEVIIATRLAPLANYDDANLSEFRRRILLRLRRTLPDLAIDDVLVSDFQLEVRSL
jgi:hypothetical protein